MPEINENGNLRCYYQNPVAILLCKNLIYLLNVIYLWVLLGQVLQAKVAGQGRCKM